MIKLVSMTLASSICLASCTLLFVPKYQKVSVTLPYPQSKLYCNDSLVGTGKVLEVKLPRGGNISQLRVETEGYRDIHATAAANKANAVHWLNLPILAGLGAGIANMVDTSRTLIGLYVGAGVGVYASAYGAMVPRGKNYRPMVFDRNLHIKRTYRSNSQKYLLVENVAISLAKGAFSIQITRKGKKNNYYAPRLTSPDSMGVDNSIFAARLNSELKKCGFVDTTKATLLKSTINKLTLRAEVIEVNATGDNPNPNPYNNQQVTEARETMSCAIKTKWQIADAYGTILFDSTVASASGIFTVCADTFHSDPYSATLARVTNDALEASMHTVLLNTKAQELLNATSQESETPQEALVIKKPTAHPTNLEEAIAACVTVAATNGKEQKWHGSGFYISQDGYIITNYHVVASATNIQIFNSDGQKFTATVARKNEVADLALLKIDATPSTAFELPTTKGYNVGIDVYAIGTPTSQELGQTLSKGIISGNRKGEAGNEVIQTDVSVSGGNSGGALINKQVELLGVVNAKLVGIGVEGIAFAIPAQNIMTFLNLKF